MTLRYTGAPQIFPKKSRSYIIIIPGARTMTEETQTLDATSQNLWVRATWWPGFVYPLHHTYTKTQTAPHRKHCAAITQLSANGMWGYNGGRMGVLWE